jgi:ATP-dependent Clp protease ATP-binding subunit ClpA
MSDNQKMYDRFSSDVLHMIVFAKAASIDAHVDALYPESFLIGTLLTGENVVTMSLHEHGVDLDKCVKRFKRRLQNRQKENENGEDGDSGVTYDEVNISKEIVEVCKRANEMSLKNNHKIVGLGHLFIAIMELHIDLRQIVSRECSNFKDCLSEILNNKYHKTTTAPQKKAKRKNKDSIIDQYCVDMTEMANNGEFDPIISRDAEIEEAITILCRRTKSNPILVGEAGVGKTAIVEGISQRIISNAVPKKLRGCRIYSLNMSGMVAGTKYRGDFEKRIQDLIKAVEEDPECILFIDEIHTIVGAGGAGSAMDAANILKPALARRLKCIGATTHQEYKKHFLEDGALSRRFGVVNVDEPSEEDVKKIMMGIKERFEQYHECVISNDAIDSIIELTKRYRPTKHFPDKAIDCMDTACAKYAWTEETEDGHLPVINSDDIARVISKQCQVPLEVIQWDTNERIHKTEEFLKGRVVGQEEAVSSVCRVLRNAYSGVRNPDRPIGGLVFGGQSGTGKTYLSKMLSQAIFGSDKSLIKIDMSEYSEEHSISKIIGSPPGYVGFKDVDVVVDKIKRRPYCILLLDEIEKANPKVMKLFLQVMQDGVITSAMGEKIDCKNIFFIMTGNFGMNDSKTSSIGFSEKGKSAIDNERERLIDFCQKAYGKEFANRVDAFVPFIELSDQDLVKIADMRLSEFTERVNHKNIKVNVSKKVAPVIVGSQSENHGMNAMAINRAISKKVQPLVADAILELEDLDSSNYTLTVDANKGGELSIKKRKRKKT